MARHEPRKTFVAERMIAANEVRSSKIKSKSGDAAPSDEIGLAVLQELKALRQEVAELKAQGSSDTSALSTKTTIDITEDDFTRDVRVEIAQMVRMIAKAKTELALIKHPMSEDDRLMAASNELDAITLATEGATHRILAAAEDIERELSNIAGLCHDDHDILTMTEKIENQITTILEACNFQDITGQRVSKVIKTMRFIEDRILSMISIWGGVEAFMDLPLPPTDHEDEDAALLQGPQLENQGITQDEIDKLFD